MRSTEFWDTRYSEAQTHSYGEAALPSSKDPVLRKALEWFGDVENRTLVDLGCGRGAASLFFAHHGANVISIDASEMAISQLAEYCSRRSITNVHPIKPSVLEISTLQEVDYVFGSLILHHIEPFEEFPRLLRDAIKPEGRALFWENNASSKTMMWFRRNIVGRLWIRRQGDPEESPLTPSEVDALREYFDVAVEYPDLLYFRMISTYLLRGRLMKPCQILDRCLFRLPEFRRLSYRQLLLLGPVSHRPDEALHLTATLHGGI